MAGDIVCKEDFPCLVIERKDERLGVAAMPFLGSNHLGQCFLSNFLALIPEPQLSGISVPRAFDACS